MILRKIKDELSKQDKWYNNIETRLTKINKDFDNRMNEMKSEIENISDTIKEIEKELNKIKKEGKSEKEKI